MNASPLPTVDQRSEKSEDAKLAGKADREEKEVKPGG